MCYFTPPDVELMLLIIENRSSTDHLMAQINMSESDSFHYSRSSSYIREYIPPRYRQLMFMVEQKGKQRCLNYPTYDLTYQHMAHARRTKSIVNSYSDGLHTPRLCLESSIS